MTFHKSDCPGHDPDRPCRILVLRPGAIGDTLVTVPALVALQRRFSEARITMVGNATALPLLRAADLIGDWLPFDHLRVTALFAGRHPTCSDWLLGISQAVAWCADPDGVLQRSLVQRGARNPIIVPSRPAPDRPVQVARHLLETLAPLGIDPEQALELPELSLPEAAEEAARYEIAAAGLDGRPFVAIHPGSGSPAKNWPAEQFAAVIDALAEQHGLGCLVLGGPADDAVLDRLLAHARSHPPVLRDRPLLTVAAVLRPARAFLGNDSGLSHLAGLLGLPTLTLFGPSDPALWTPLGRQAHIIRSERLSSLSVSQVLETMRHLTR